jgi:transcriptional regulator with XRE-family HTH domain
VDESKQQQVNTADGPRQASRPEGSVEFDPIALARAVLPPGFTEFRRLPDPGRLLALDRNAGRVLEVTLGPGPTVRELAPAKAQHHLSNPKPWPQPQAKKPVRRSAAEKEFGTRIKRARQKAKVLRKVLACKLKISQEELVQYEKGWGQMQISTLVQYAELTKMPVEWFFRRDGDPPPMNIREALGVLTALVDEAEKFRPRLDAEIAKVTELTLENQALRYHQSIEQIGERRETT